MTGNDHLRWENDWENDHLRWKNDRKMTIYQKHFSSKMTGKVSFIARK